MPRRSSEDVNGAVLDWAVECCTVDPAAYDRLDALASSWQSWARQHGMKPGPASVSRVLLGLGCRQVGDGDTALLIGAEVRSPAEMA
jgi:hypothetical protein